MVPIAGRGVGTATGTVGSLGGAEVTDTLCAIRGPINRGHGRAFGDHADGGTRPNVGRFIMRFRAGSMLRKFRADYPAMLAVMAILFGTFVLGGIAYTYTHRPALIDAVTHLIDGRQLPADL